MYVYVYHIGFISLTNTDQNKHVLTDQQGQARVPGSSNPQIQGKIPCSSSMHPLAFASFVLRNFLSRIPTQPLRFRNGDLGNGAF